MAIEVFNRYEKKYMLSFQVFDELKERLLPYMNLDKYCENSTYPINNIYYDTFDNNIIRKSLSKPKYKEKLRLRGYGVPGLEDKVYLELKKKVNGLVNKRRTALKLGEGYEFIDTGVQPLFQPYMNGQVLNEIEYFLANHTVKPALYLAYDRIAFFAKEAHDIRITFDTNIRARRYDLGLELGDYGDPLVKEGYILMEVKVSRSIPLWMVDILSNYKIYQTSFSKYGVEYQMMLQKQKGIDTRCLNKYSIQHREPLHYQSIVQ